MKYTFTKALPIAALSMAALLFSSASYAQLSLSAAPPSIAEGSTDAQLRCIVDGTNPNQAPFTNAYGATLNGVNLATVGSSIWYPVSDYPNTICGTVAKGMCDYIKHTYPEGSYVGDAYIDYPVVIHISATVFGQNSTKLFGCI